MVSNNLQGRSRLRRIALPTSFVVGLGVSAASCAADLADPDAYTVARNQGVGSGGTAAPTGGTVATSGGSTTVGGSTTTGGTMGGAPPPLPDCVTTVLSNNSCSNSCHSAGAAALIGGGLDLSGNPTAKLNDVVAKNAKATDMAACGRLLIDSANPANSILLKRVKGAGACGPGMPTDTGISAADQQCLTAWIDKF